MPHCHVGVCSSSVHCREIQECFSKPIDDGPRTPKARFHWLMQELEKRFPHPRPFDSSLFPEMHYLESIDKLIGSSNGKPT